MGVGDDEKLFSRKFLEHLKDYLENMQRNYTFNSRKPNIKKKPVSEFYRFLRVWILEYLQLFFVTLFLHCNLQIGAW